MDLKNLFLNKELIYLDTCIFIFYFEANLKYADLCENIFENIEKNKIKIIASPLMLTELMVYPLKNQQTKIADKWLNFFKTCAWLEFKELTPQTALTAATIRANQNLKTPDSIHLATAIENNCQLFITNDLKYKELEELQILCLDDMLENY